MRPFIATILSLVLLMATSAAAAKLRVVATTPDIASVAREIGGARVSVKALALHTQDPHWVDPKPHLAMDLARADLLLVSGAELEAGWLPTLLTASRNGKIQPGAQGHLECSTLVTLRDVPKGKVDRSRGDVHPRGNPHYMYDPRRVERVAVGIGKRMAKLDPANKGAYLEGTKRFIERLRKARKAWEKTLSHLRGEEVIAYHKSLAYLANWLELKVVEHVEPRPGIPPNPRHVAHLLEEARDHHVRIFLQESWFPDSTTKLLAKKTGGKLVQFVGMPNFDKGQSYVDYMASVVAALARAAKEKRRE